MNSLTERLVGRVLLSTLVIAYGLGVHVIAAGTAEGSALELIRASVARVQGMVRSDAGRGSERQRTEIRRVAETLFDFEAMSRRMLARHWNDGSPQQQAEFVGLLASFLERTYIEVIANGAWVSITVDGESIDGSYAQVRTRMGMDVGPEIAIEYRLSKSGERWAVYDVLHDGASLVSNYRSQFSSILRTSSFAQLLDRMRRNEARGRVGDENIEDIGRRLLLFSVVTERSTR